MQQSSQMICRLDALLSMASLFDGDAGRGGSCPDRDHDRQDGWISEEGKQFELVAPYSSALPAASFKSPYRKCFGPSISCSRQFSPKHSRSRLTTKQELSQTIELGPNFRMADKIGIGAAVTHRPLPHHRAYGSVHGGSRSYAVTRRLAKVDRAI